MNDAYSKFMLPAAALMFLCLWLSPPCPAHTAELRLYVLDCGHANFKDMAGFSDTGEYDGKRGQIAAPCFLIRHPKGDLLWDAGLGDHYNYPKDGSDVAPGVHVTVPVTLLAQLQSLSLTPKDINYIAFSHLHWDHTGNANEFPDSVWIMNKTELAYGLVSPPPGGVLPETWSAYKSAKNELIEGDYDVFGDGTVTILRAPGHTPGHQVLKLKLAKSGTVILSGDLYHLRANRLFKRVPVYNADRADTLASMSRIETILKNTHGRLIVQHDPRDFQALPKPPAYLD
ncbi:MAG TPA: N-acyl homoserine lactonase family protein [Steroidobacteraceae bacterium]|jgi:glyoxylase-like metal-dependent hydrolase (beta-lactamase superfamily II)|nr:N-acyl homoserine lactonase family protein [Steroidobacteraceae bacterium]